MSIKAGKRRVMITIPENRLKMIRERAENENLSVSQYLTNSGTVSYEEWLKKRNKN